MQLQNLFVLYRGGAQDDVFRRTGNRIEEQCSLLDGASVD